MASPLTPLDIWRGLRARHDPTAPTQPSQAANTAENRYPPQVPHRAIHAATGYPTREPMLPPLPETRPALQGASRLDRWRQPPALPQHVATELETLLKAPGGENEFLTNTYKRTSDELQRIARVLSAEDLDDFLEICRGLQRYVNERSRNVISALADSHHKENNACKTREPALLQVLAAKVLRLRLADLSGPDNEGFKSYICSLDALLGKGTAYRACYKKHVWDRLAAIDRGESSSS